MTDAEFALAEYLYKKGFGAEAIAHFKEAQRLAPDNWNYKRQAWALSDAERDYGTTFMNEVKKLNGGKGVDYVVECSAATSAVNDAVRMVNRGGRVCLAAFAHEEVPVDVAHIVRNNIYVYGIRGEGTSATHRAEAFMQQKLKVKGDMGLAMKLQGLLQ